MMFIFWFSSIYIYKTIICVPFPTSKLPRTVAVTLFVVAVLVHAKTEMFRQSWGLEEAVAD